MTNFSETDLRKILAMTIRLFSNARFEDPWDNIYHSLLMASLCCIRDDMDGEEIEDGLVRQTKLLVLHGQGRTGIDDVQFMKQMRRIHEQPTLQ